MKVGELINKINAISLALEKKKEFFRTKIGVLINVREREREAKELGLVVEKSQ